MSLLCRRSGRDALCEKGHSPLNLLGGVRRRDKEPQPGSALAHRRVENRPGIDAAIQQRGRDSDAAGRIAQDNRDHRRFKAGARIESVLLGQIREMGRIAAQPRDALRLALENPQRRPARPRRWLAVKRPRRPGRASCT